MAFGLDYVTGPPIATLKAAGVTFVCRYLSEVNDLTRVKLLTAEEAKALTEAGIALVSNYEWYANRALEGAASGKIDAQIAAAQHAACGGPADRPIYFSVDFDASDAQMGAVIDYFHGVASVLGLARTGAYGSYRVIKALFDAGAITWGWQTYAWSAGQWEPRAHLQQYQNGVSLDGRSVDYDRSTTSDVGQWFQGGTMQRYTEHAADFGLWFTASDADHWTCKKTGRVVQFGIKDFYAALSMDGNSLPIVGLPLTDEISLSVQGNRVVLQVFERAGIFYDPAHLKDHQPGTGACALCHLTDADFLKHVPGFAPPVPPAVDTSQVEADIHAIAEAITAPIARALADLKTL
jgi:hypothetical protein